MKRIFLLALIPPLLWACAEENWPVDASCGNFPKEPIIGWDHVYVEDNYGDPYFNPANNNEFVYVYFNGTTFNYQLRIHNLATGEDRILIHQSSNIINPLWSTSGWIYFNDDNYSLFKINEQGHGLSQITDKKRWLVNYDHKSNLIFFYHYFPNNDVNNSYYYFIDCNTGQYVDTVHYVSIGLLGIREILDWPNKLVAGFRTDVENNKYYLKQLNLITHTENILYQWNLNSISTGEFKYMEQLNRVFFSDKSGIYSVNLTNGFPTSNLTNGATTKIKSACPLVYYTNLSFAADGLSFLAERQEFRPLNHKVLEERTRLVKLNIDGSNEQVLALP